MLLQVYLCVLRHGWRHALHAWAFRPLCTAADMGEYWLLCVHVLTLSHPSA
jgi:hypothetical protein